MRSGCRISFRVSTTGCRDAVVRANPRSRCLREAGNWAARQPPPTLRVRCDTGKGRSDRYGASRPVNFRTGTGWLTGRWWIPVPGRNGDRDGDPAMCPSALALHRRSFQTIVAAAGSRLPSLAPVIPVGIPVYGPAPAYSDGDRHAGMVVRAPCVQRFRTPGRAMSKRMTEPAQIACRVIVPREDQ